MASHDRVIFMPFATITGNGDDCAPVSDMCEIRRIMVILHIRSTHSFVCRGKWLENVAISLICSAFSCARA